MDYEKHIAAAPSLISLSFALLLSATLLLPGLARAQDVQTRGVRPAGSTQSASLKGNTYAVIVGVSDYENPNIPDLNYAHVDAAAFVRFLQSPAGGAVPDSNITFLQNESATAGQVAAALNGLLERCQEGDRAIIYFSGHGDVERKTLTQPGFLLCRDAPSSVYMGGGTFPLFWMQEVVTTLSVQNKSDVIVFTDACHAGKLAGSSISGAEITALNLAKTHATETKILSCQPNEFSLEGREWGGGRGVFSFYLIQGLTGLADRNNDGVVTVLEIERYLEDAVSSAASPHPQLPVVVGNKMTPIAWVDSASLANLLHSSAREETGLLAQIDSRDVEDALLASRDSGTFVQYRVFKKALKEGRLLDPEDQCAYTLFYALKDRPAMKPFEGVMRRNLAAAFQDEAQRAINDYLASEPEELRKRWARSSQYERYPVYLEKSAELLGNQHFMYSAIKAREFYFRGLNLRLKGEPTEDNALYLRAIQFQKEALSLDENAAYAYNELGLLARRRGNFSESVDYFNKALAISPGWALPWTNLCAVYLDDKQYDLAITCGIRANEIDPNLPLAQFNLGVAYEHLGQPQKAGEHYGKAIQLDKAYALGYFNLGLLRYREGKFEEAVSLWMQYHRLAPQDAAGCQNIAMVYMDLGQPDSTLSWLQQALRVDPTYLEAQFNIVEFYMMQEKSDLAESALQTYLKQKPDDPRGHYLQARIYAGRNALNDALNALTRAFELGFREVKSLEMDDAMAALRNLPGYTDLLSRFNN